MGCFHCDSSAVMLNDIAPYASLALLCVGVACFIYTSVNERNAGVMSGIVKCYFTVTIVSLAFLTFYLFFNSVELFDPNYYGM